MAYLYNATKVSRIFARRGESFIDVISRNAKYLTITSESGTKFPVYKGNPNLPRLRQCFEYIARGLYYHEFQEPFKGDCIIMLGFVTYQDETFQKHVEVVKRRSAFDEKNLTSKGANPTVFKYHICEPDEFGLISLKMTFYNGATVYVCFKGISSSEPFSLAHQFIDAGLKVSIEFPDGKPPIEFNS